eukprot:CAMPEP_0202383778 /NCGR_PEP_ID=MMETSP1127-20130417/51234_1 /ASSEMBLY_ACC=CAM_ASM_000462 /TAXON_ID=3047 /ORGANISM="Dunaliella tertiolecta, Strain CCMP1320" /LENGTH=124 /DNA_ID=CAMNT_0048983363 /DNA_START=298 /DNA_END=668 /DNA_ORIENTATION=+
MLVAAASWLSKGSASDTSEDAIAEDALGWVGGADTLYDGLPLNEQFLFSLCICSEMDFRSAAVRVAPSSFSFSCSIVSCAKRRFPREARRREFAMHADLVLRSRAFLLVGDSLLASGSWKGDGL